MLGLTVGDYLLWNWSLSANHDVVALISGLTLPPLALLSIWLLAITAAELLGVLTRRRRAARADSGRTARRFRSRPAHSRAAAKDAPAAVRAAAAEAASRKIAA